MEFGVPKEVRSLEGETRVGLTPAGVQGLVQAGHTVYVEKNAGVGAGFDNEAYRAHGAQIVYAAAEVYGRSDIVVKVARPAAKEHALFRPGQTIFSFLHLQSSSPDLLEALEEREITAIAYEMIQAPNSMQPILFPMSQVAGRLAPIIAGQLLMNNNGGRGTLLSGIPGVPRGVAAIVGAGTLGTNAARAFLGLGAQVIVLDDDVCKLKMIDDLLNGRVTTMLATSNSLHRVTEFADVIVGCIRQPGRRADQIISTDMVRHMRPGSVILDFSIDDGGCVETSRPTTLRDPIFVADEVIHYCVPNVPATVSRTTSYALTNVLLPYLTAVATRGIVGMVDSMPGFAHGIMLYQGNLAHPEIAAALGREVTARLPYGGTQ